MTSMHNRRGSVLLMAIGMLTILAILASTFLVISNLDSEETESLSVRAYADPIGDGLLAKAIAQISFDRAVNATPPCVPYGAMLATSNGLVGFMDYPHPYTSTETTDHWLSPSYIPGEGISGQLTNLVGPDLLGACAGKTFLETATYTDGQDAATNPEYIDTDGDGIPDAKLYDTKISSPLGGADANTNYYAAVRIEDLSSRMCINTASGWSTTESVSDRPSGSGPDMVDLRTFLDKRSGTAVQKEVYPLLNAGDGSTKGRIGDATASTKNYSRYCGSCLLSPGKSYQPFGIGDEVFFLNACKYTDNLSQFGGRINQMISANTGAANTLLDNIRRQLTTMNSVSSLVRWPNTDPAVNFTEPLVINTVQTAADCQLVYDRMKLMLEATGIGKTDNDRATMAAHFAANLWAYCSQDKTGEPWKFTPSGQNFAVFGLRQEIVITQVFARHISNSKYDANDPSKDDSAWGYAVEVSNPTETGKMFAEYELELKTQDGTTTIVPLSGTAAPFNAPAANATTPTKRVVYGYGFGPSRTTMTTAQLFGEATTGWYWDNKMDFRKSTPSLSITLYHKVGGERVPIDVVTVGNNASWDLPYDTNLQLPNISGKSKDISGDHPSKSWSPTKGNPYVNIRRDDRLKDATAGTRFARFNLAMYKCDGPTENTGNLTSTKLGQANSITQTDLTRCTYRTPISGVYSPGIYRPRNVTVTVAPSARESMPTDGYYLPSLADLGNIYLTGPYRGTAEMPFTVGILQAARSVLFADRLDIGRMPSAKLPPEVSSMTDVAFNAATAKYPDVPPGYMFHEFFTRTPGHQARSNEKKRIYGTININTLALPQTATYNCAAWWLPWPVTSTSGTPATNTGNRLALGLGGLNFTRDAAISAIRQYRDQTGRAALTGITGLRSAAGSDIAGFMTPGEVGIPLAMYMDTLLKASTAECEKDSDYVRARNCLFGYISDGIATRSDVYACYVTVQHGKNAGGRRWRYVAVIDRSNVINPTDKAALILLTQLR